MVNSKGSQFVWAILCNTKSGFGSRIWRADKIKCIAWWVGCGQLNYLSFAGSRNCPCVSIYRSLVNIFSEYVVLVCMLMLFSYWDERLLNLNLLLLTLRVGFMPEWAGKWTSKASRHRLHLLSSEHLGRPTRHRILTPCSSSFKILARSWSNLSGLPVRHPESTPRPTFNSVVTKSLRCHSFTTSTRVRISKLLMELLHRGLARSARQPSSSCSNILSIMNEIVFIAREKGLVWDAVGVASQGCIWFGG